MMGWTGTHRDKGMTNDDFFRAEFPNMLGREGRILASSSVRGTYYAAVQQVDTGEVWALVVLTSRAPRSYFNFSYKELTETMGPAEDECPANILALLSPTTDEYAVEWRARCQENLAKRAAQPKVKRGMTVRFAEPLTFTSGYEGDTFTFEGYSIFWTVGGSRCRIPGWRDRQFELVV